jgi:hypothetical protein
LTIDDSGVVINDNGRSPTVNPKSKIENPKSLLEFFEQGLGRFQIGRIKTFRKPVVNAGQ